MSSSSSSSSAALTRVMVTGSTGMTGRAVVRHLEHEPACVACARLYFSRPPPSALQSPQKFTDHRVDLRDASALEAVFREFRPTAVVHCAAERRPDACEKDADGSAAALNEAAPKLLASLCASTDATLIHLSTDYVFDGSAPPYTPQSAPNPLQAYGRSKLNAERAVLEACPRTACVLRVPVLLAADQASLDESATTAVLASVLKQYESGERRISVDDWGARYPAFCEDVASYIVEMLRRSAEVVGDGGRVWHFATDCPRHTKYSLARRMLEIVGRADDIVPCLVPDSAPPPGAPRPHDCRLDGSALDAVLLTDDGSGGASVRLRRTPLDEALRAALRSFSLVDSVTS